MAVLCVWRYAATDSVTSECLLKWRTPVWKPSVSKFGHGPAHICWNITAVITLFCNKEAIRTPGDCSVIQCTFCIFSELIQNGCRNSITLSGCNEGSLHNVCLEQSLLVGLFCVNNICSVFLLGGVSGSMLYEYIIFQNAVKFSINKQLTQLHVYILLEPQGSVFTRARH